MTGSRQTSHRRGRLSQAGERPKGGEFGKGGGMVMPVAAVDPHGGSTLTRARMPSHLTWNAPPAGGPRGETSIGATRHKYCHQPAAKSPQQSEGRGQSAPSQFL